MHIGRMRRIVITALCLTQTLCKILPPPVNIRALKPKGFIVSIPDDPGITKYEFECKVNDKISFTKPGNIREQLTKHEDGRWSYRNGDVELKLGDILYYRYKYVKYKEGVHSNTKEFLVQDLIDIQYLEHTPRVGDCVKSLTVLRETEACSGDIIFEDNFDTLREGVWRFEQYIPSEPDYPFVSYQHHNNAHVIFVEDGYLKIEPKLLQNISPYSGTSILSGTLDLTNGCTSTPGNCEKRASRANILPPIVSGRITATSLAFTYGTVEIRAKLPHGDWLYPDILLQSIYDWPGTFNKHSGVVRIAGARGNLDLKEGDTEYGNKVLYGGVILNAGCRNDLLNQTVGTEPWGSDFHVYSLRWAPESITLSVDGREWAKYEPGADGLKSLYTKQCQLKASLSKTSKIAPFNEYFSLTLGVSAGGLLEFPDDVVSGVEPKPWRNSQSKSLYNFYQELIQWWATWTQPALTVDYVRVYAL
ncbi:beta-1,3-glucan-binding protein-like [Aricia agestis]|uniref:beta-1,3-glucan-binding protein-like n=1 Tax=Aricia agestis TaxID=91739 RepID=UPI001C2026E8|nr:beta-1,3-glucan-binding protein-like [Aricia agestis]